MLFKNTFSPRQSRKIVFILLMSIKTGKGGEGEKEKSLQAQEQ